MGEFGQTLRRAQSVFRSKKAIADGGLHVLARRIAILKGEVYCRYRQATALADRWKGAHPCYPTGWRGATMAFPSKVGDIGLQVETVEAVAPSGIVNGKRTSKRPSAS